MVKGGHPRPRWLIFKAFEDRRLLSASVTGLSFRDGNQLDSKVLDGIHSGNNVYLRADATEMEGQTIDVQVWEDDGIKDDLITTVQITIGAQGFGTFAQRLFGRSEIGGTFACLRPLATRSRAVSSTYLRTSLRQQLQSA